jgi:hypothetical protein
LSDLAKALACGAVIATGLALAAVAGPPDLEAYRVTRPDALLFDRAARHEALAAMTQGQRERLCGTDREGWPKHGVVHNVYNGAQPGEEFTFTMMIAAADAFGMGDAAAAEAVVRNLSRWAADDGLGKFKKEPAP